MADNNNPNTAAAITAGASLASTGMGLALQSRGINKQVKAQGKIMGMQSKHAKDLADYQQQKQLEMWEKTNYPGQMEQLKKAGLNPGLIYGMSGGGGATTGAGTSTGVSGGSINAQIPEISPALGIALSQIELNKSQANKNNTEANLIGGAQTNLVIAQTNKIGTEIDALKQGIESEKAKQYLTEAQTTGQNILNAINKASQDDAIQIIANNAKLGIMNIRKAAVEANIAEQTEEDQIKTIHEQSIGAVLTNALTVANIQNIKAGTNFTNQQINESISKIGLNETNINAIKTGVVQKWVEVGLNKRSLDQKDISNLTEAFKASMQHGGIPINSPQWIKSLKGFNDYLQNVGHLGVKIIQTGK